MTNNKTYFNQWLKRSNVGEVVNNFPRLPLVEVKVDGYPLFTVVGYVPENIVKDYADILRKKLNEKQED